MQTHGPSHKGKSKPKELREGALTFWRSTTAATNTPTAAAAAAAASTAASAEADDSPEPARHALSLLLLNGLGALRQGLPAPDFRGGAVSRRRAVFFGLQAQNVRRLH